ncbi:MAG: class I SAM-dependent methyltransferase [Tepidanaerobacter acetatoxydans]|uniref:class I SAM-dependent methyltransferase n=1 Tax=Tepidanaerobacter acetatoxydans TaxID=499229 RepID=UPI001BD5F500|nr:class I SAM-dependent methyltransferase [Tepidanaerobacter acetatoxydans]NLU11250.1 class I SAM-dependent methyltransferase [Tepidanaerobacter acetatoxydans]
MDLKDKSIKYWDDSADIYSELIIDEINSFKKESWKNLIKENLGKNKYKNVLDIGTGPGFFAIIMAEMGYDVTAIDSSEHMLKQAISNAKIAGVNANFLKCDINDCNLPKESFDVIISRNVTWTLQDPVKVYKIWYDLLKPGGKVLIFDANWNARLVNKEIRRQHEKDLDLARKMGHYIDIEDELKAEGDEVSLKLYLTYQVRPEWDKKVLTQIGFKNLVIVNEIDDQIYTEAERIANRTTPTFSICATK